MIKPLDHQKLLPRPKMMATSRYGLENIDREVKVK
jgi:hypothetical protein